MREWERWTRGVIYEDHGVVEVEGEELDFKVALTFNFRIAMVSERVSLAVANPMD